MCWNVSRESSYTYRLELRLKRELRKEIEKLDRGNERVAVPLRRIRKLLYLDVLDEADKTFDITKQAMDVLTVVDQNRSRRLRALNPKARALPEGVGRG
jgi:hypothetical protein